MKIYLLKTFPLVHVNLFQHGFLQKITYAAMTTGMNNSFEKYLHFKFRAKLFGVSCDWLVVLTHCKNVRETNKNGPPCAVDRNRVPCENATKLNLKIGVLFCLYLQ